MTTMQSLTEQIDALVAKNTFGLDALEGIKRIKDDLSRTLNELDSTKKFLDKAKEANIEANAQLAQRNAHIEALTKERDALREREKKADEAIYAAEKHKAVADTWQSAMAMVFKPNAVRESVQRNHTVVIPNGTGSGYTQAVQNQDSITREDA